MSEVRFDIEIGWFNLWLHTEKPARMEDNADSIPGERTR